MSSQTAFPSFRFPLGTSAAVTLENLRDVLTEPATPLDDAAVTMTLRDGAGAAVAGADGLTMSLVEGTNDYRGVLPPTLTLTAGASYTLEVRADAGDGKVRLFKARAVFE